MIIHSNVTHTLGEVEAKKLMPKSYTSAKSLPLRKFVQNVLIGFGQSICFPKNVSSAFILTNTEKQIKVVFAQRHNFR